MELTYKQLEQILRQYFDIASPKVSTFRSRIKQLQRLKFPPGVNVGRGAKMVYSAEQLFQLTTAFELLNNGFPAATATDLLSEYWGNFSDAFAIKESDNRLNKDTPRYILFTLAKIKYTDDAHVTIESVSNLQDALSAKDGKSLNSFQVIDVGGIVNSLADICATLQEVDLPQNAAYQAR